MATGPTALDRLYAALAACAFGFARLLARVAGATQEELRARSGELPDARRPLLWFHGASAGEISAATRLAGVLREHGYCFAAGYTAANRAGVEYALRAGGPQSVAAAAPWDVSRWISRAFDRWQPAALLLVETELWPALVLEASRRGVPVVCISARIYPRDLPRYRAVRRLIAPTMRRLTAVLAQNETERTRFINLGAAEDRCIAAGNLKYLPVAKAVPAAEESFGIAPGRQVLVFGSLHADEIGLAFSALDHLGLNGLRVIMAPRHRSAAQAILEHSRRRRLSARLRSEGSGDGAWQVLILDTMGELRCAYGVATVAVVGGGFRNHGGHNLLEPLSAGSPVLFGPHCGHFEHEALALASLTPAARVADAGELGERLAEWLKDEGRRRQMLALQRRALPDPGAIASRYLEALEPLLRERLF